jgi:hypothetical protein
LLLAFELGRATLPVQILVILFFFLLAGLLLASLPTLLAALSGLVLLARFSGLAAMLSRVLLTLLVFHIVCHDEFSIFHVRIPAHSAI